MPCSSFPIPFRGLRFIFNIWLATVLWGLSIKIPICDRMSHPHKVMEIVEITYGVKWPELCSSSSHLRTCALFWTLCADPRPTNEVGVVTVAQDEGQSLPAIQDASAPGSNRPAIGFP